MGVHVHGGTVPGGVTPICEECGVSLCWDLSREEHEADRAFWDAWTCRDCNGGRPLSLAAWRAARAVGNSEGRLPAEGTFPGAP